MKEVWKSHFNFAGIFTRTITAVNYCSGEKVIQNQTLVLASFRETVTTLLIVSYQSRKVQKLIHFQPDCSL
jgi:hypothetical protein